MAVFGRFWRVGNFLLLTVFWVFLKGGEGLGGLIMVVGIRIRLGAVFSSVSETDFWIFLNF